MVRRQVVLEVLACTHAMAVLELRQEVECLSPILLQVVVQAARASARLQARPQAREGCLVLPARLVPHLLPVGCLDKVEAAAVVVLLARAVLVARVDVALAAVAVVQHAAHTQQAMVA